MLKALITRKEDGTFAVVTSLMLSDGQLEQDDNMALVETPEGTYELQPIYEKGSIRIRSFRMRLGRISAEAVRNLKPGETAELHR